MRRGWGGGGGWEMCALVVCVYSAGVWNALRKLFNHTIYGPTTDCNVVTHPDSTCRVHSYHGGGVLCTVDFTSLRMSVSVKRKRVERYRSAY